MLPLTPPQGRAPPDRVRSAPRFELPRLRLSLESVLLLACTWLALVPNRPFVLGTLRERDPAQPATWGFGLALLLGLLALHLLLLLPLSGRWTIKPLVALLLVVSAVASFSMQQ